MKDGEIKGTVFQDAKAQAETSAKYIMMAVKGTPVPKMTAIPFLAVTKANVDDFLKLSTTGFLAGPVSRDRSLA